MSYTFYGQTKIKGFISDEIGPLPRANIIIKNTKTGTVSNMDGYYEIDAKVNDTLSISYLGYNTQDILVNSQKNINTLLKGDIALDEVEIIAYGSISCRTIYCGGVFRKITDNSKNFKSDLITQSLYPNPSKDGRFQLNLLDSYKNVEIEIINMSG